MSERDGPGFPPGRVLRPGQRLGRYRLLEELGAGGMGVVYLAHDEELRRDVALKTVAVDLASSPERLERFQREARALAAVEHPSIVTIYSVEEEGGVSFLTMERVDGKPLDQIVPAGGLELRQLLSVATSIVDALVAAHTRGIIHRDLKPANIMVTATGAVKVLDFGLAKQTAAGADASQLPTEAMLTRQGVALGTARYMSPEHVEGKVIDERSDLFSFGIVLYEMATGQRTFVGGTGAAVMSAILRDTPARLRDLRPQLPERLEELILQCLEKEPAKRPQSAREVRAALEDVEESSSSARPARRRVPPWLIAAVAILGLVLAWWALVDRTRPGESPAVSADLGPDAAAPAAAARVSVAVLPFENLSAGKDDDYFAEGVHDEILARVAKIEALRVTSRTSVMEFADRRGNAREIAERLGVEHMVEGTVRRIGDRVRITIQLIDAIDDMHLWSQVYEREWTDLFEVQTDVARQIAQALSTELSPNEHERLATVPTRNAAAYDLYLKSLRAEPGEAIGLLQEAIDLDPEFALAEVRLANLHLALYFFNIDPSDDRRARARAAVDRALELDPDLPEAHLALGRYHYWGHRDYRRALQQFEIARRGLPNDITAFTHTAEVQRRLGKFGQAAANYREALARDPGSASFSAALGQTLMFLRQFSEAERHLKRALVSDPEQPTAMMFLTWLHLTSAGDIEQARSVLERYRGDRADPYFFAWQKVAFAARDYEGVIAELSRHTWPAIRLVSLTIPRDMLLAHAYRGLGRGEEARGHLEKAREWLDGELERRPDDHRLLAAMAIVGAGLGEHTEAIELARRAVAQLPISQDAMDGTLRVEDLAQVYAWAGREREALDQIEALLELPGLLTIEALRLEPRWDPLRQHPRFRQLVE